MLTLSQPEKLRASLITHEGNRLKPYVDTTGHLTIGVGHNLTDLGISSLVSQQILSEDIAMATLETDKLLPWVRTLDEVRKRAFIELVFNLGGRLLTFQKALEAAQHGNWGLCGLEFRTSLWAKQVGQRATVIAGMLVTGRDPGPV